MKAQKGRMFYVDLGYAKLNERAALYTKEKRWFVTSLVLEMMPSVHGPVIETEDMIYWPAPPDGFPVQFEFRFAEKRNASNPTGRATLRLPSSRRAG